MTKTWKRLKSSCKKNHSLRLPMTLLIAAGLFGCTTYTDDLVESGRVDVIKAGKADKYVLSVRVQEDEKGVVVHGRVRPGIRSHIPRSNARHIDVLVNVPDRNMILDGIVRLNSRQRYFFHRMKSDLPAKSVITINYARLYHSSHATDLLSRPFDVNLESTSPTSQKGK